MLTRVTRQSRQVSRCSAARELGFASTVTSASGMKSKYLSTSFVSESHCGPLSTVGVPPPK